MPGDFESLTTAEAVCAADTAQEYQVDFDTQWGANGEDLAAGSDGLANQTHTFTVDQRYDWDISGALDGIAAGDYVGLRCNQDTAAAVMIWWFGVEFVYVRGT